MTAALINHLWQSTLFAFGAGLLTLALRRNGARFRYGLWFAASVKFLIPYALLDLAGGWIGTRLHPLAQTPAGFLVVRRVLQPFAPAPAAPAAAPMIAAPPSVAAHVALHSGAILLVVWALGAATVLTLWALRWRRVRAALRASSPLDLSTRVPARSSPSLLEPGVVGVFRQVLMLPKGIEDHLSAAEMDAVLIHELHHLRRRDNLTAAIHMLVEALFWFHPLVWWIGGRLIAERERACDESVIGAGADPRVYAEAILKVCRFYLQSPLACAAGVSGSNLKRRMATIMTGSPGAPLGARKTLLVSTAAVLAVAAPLAAALIAAVPAAARTAILDKVGLKDLAPTSAAADIPPAASDHDDTAPAVDAEARRRRTIVQSLKQGAAIVAAPADTLIAAAHIEPLAAPTLQLAALAAPESERVGGVAETAPIPAPPSPPAGCRLPALATFRVDPRAYLPLINGEINGRRVQFLVAVSSRTAVFRSAAKDLGVFEETGHEHMIYTPAPAAIGHGWVHDLELDDMPRKILSSYDVHEDFRVSVTDGGAGGTPTPAAVLGAQFWAFADEDFDLGSNSISLVRPAGCARTDTLPFNGGAYSQTRLLTPPTTAIDYLVTVIVDGVPLTAEIDTGTSTTIMTRQGAFKLSHVWPLPDAQPQGELFTAGRRKISWAKARFKTFSIGQESIQNPRIAVADLYDRAEEIKARWMDGSFPRPDTFTRPAVTIPDVILGADFFHAHHVLISNSRRMVYFVYNGAPIFQ